MSAWSCRARKLSRESTPSATHTFYPWHGVEFSTADGHIRFSLSWRWASRPGTCGLRARRFRALSFWTTLRLVRAGDGGRRRVTAGDGGRRRVVRDGCLPPRPCRAESGSRGLTRTCARCAGPNTNVAVPRGATVIAIVGEIDCREGVFTSVLKSRPVALNDKPENIISQYVATLMDLRHQKNLTVYVHPVPPILNETRYERASRPPRPPLRAVRRCPSGQGVRRARYSSQRRARARGAGAVESVRRCSPSTAC